jgi:hypothetical protein
MRKIVLLGFAVLLAISGLGTSSAQTAAPVQKVTQGDNKQERHERRSARRVHHKRRHHHKHHKRSA